LIERALHPKVMSALVYAGLSTAIVSSLGMLLVPAISREMDVSVSTAQWMLTINLLIGAIATPVMGRLGDGPHKKRLLLSALSIILVGSLLAATASNFTMFMIGRALQGLTYGIIPVTIALARRCVDAPKVSSAISSLSVTLSTGMGVGYPLTGVIAGLVAGDSRSGSRHCSCSRHSSWYFAFYPLDPMEKPRKRRSIIRGHCCWD
jgi:predicted MFS family arabinose efflux permease